MIKKSIKEKIKEYFFTHPSAKLRVRQVERVIGVPIPSAIRYCKELEEEGILQSLNIAGVHLYTADSSSPHYLLEKKCFNLKTLHNSGIIEYIKKRCGDPPIVVFGSFAQGEDYEESDIDLYIETPLKAFSLPKKVTKLLNLNVHLLIYEKIEKVENPYLRNSILNGITLNGLIEVY